MSQHVQERYKKIVDRYMQSRSERDLYAGQLFSRRFIENDISPEEVISIHKNTLQELVADVPEEVWDSFDFLVEMMIHYGLALREHQSLVRKQEELVVEMKIAARVQDTLLKTKPPDFKGLDIGVITLPAKLMSGDYVYFVSDGEKSASMAVADVIGKGMPAALCMSMIKFSMDGLEEGETSPHKALALVNRIVEKSIDDSMFVSMYYGKYDNETSVFSYASAGHEPAMFYKASEERFYLLEAKGLLLGVHADVEYEEHEVKLDEGDFVVIMTDGVTETRTKDGFIEEEYIQELLLNCKARSSQEMADYVYQQLGEMQSFHFHDDFTIVVLKKEV